MPEAAAKHLHMLLVEPETLLRRTVSLTARSLGLGQVHEAASLVLAERMLRERPYHGAVIAIDCEPGSGCSYNLNLLDLVRMGLSVSDKSMPIAVMTSSATAELLKELRERDIKQVILKPFRARVLLEAFAAFGPDAG